MKLLTDLDMAKTPSSSLRSGNYWKGDYCSINSKMKIIRGWNLKPLKKSEKWGRLRKKSSNYKQQKDTIQKIQPWAFQPGDLVWRVWGEAEKDPRVEKLGPNWEGPYMVTTNLDNGAYWLQELDGKAIPRMWNVTHMKFYFSWLVLQTQCCTLFPTRVFCPKRKTN